MTKQILSVMGFAAMNGTNATRPGRKQVGRYTVGRNIVAKCRPGKWYAPREIAKVIGATEDDARRIVGRLCSRPAYGARAERKTVGTETHYRIFKQDKTVSVRRADHETQTHR